MLELQIFEKNPYGAVHKIRNPGGGGCYENVTVCDRERGVGVNL